MRERDGRSIYEPCCLQNDEQLTSLTQQLLSNSVSICGLILREGGVVDGCGPDLTVSMTPQSAANPVADTPAVAKSNAAQLAASFSSLAIDTVTAELNDSDISATAAATAPGSPTAPLGLSSTAFARHEGDSNDHRRWPQPHIMQRPPLHVHSATPLPYSSQLSSSPVSCLGNRNYMPPTQAQLAILTDVTLPTDGVNNVAGELQSSQAQVLQPVQRRENSEQNARQYDKSPPVPCMLSHQASVQQQLKRSSDHMQSDDKQMSKVARTDADPRISQQCKYRQ